MKIPLAWRNLTHQKRRLALSLAGIGFVVLLMFIAALSWSAIFPASCRCLGFPLPNFWWQLVAVGALTVAALFCGWLQDRLGWTPAEVSFDPPAPAHDHHGHGHGHH